MTNMLSLSLAVAATALTASTARAQAAVSNDSAAMTPANATAPRQLASMAFDQCAMREKNVEYWGQVVGHDMSANKDCCGLCAQKPGCVAYSTTQGSSYTGCLYFSSITYRRGSSLPSGRLEKETPTCPTQQPGTELDGPDIRVATTWTNWQCCEECNKTPACAAYSWTLESSQCRLKYAAGASKAKSGVTSGVVKEVNTQCPTQQPGVRFLGAVLDTRTMETTWHCCDECSKTPKCTAYSYTANQKQCALFEQTTGTAPSIGVVSAVNPSPVANPACPTSMPNTAFDGPEIRKVTGVSNWQCCDECGKTAGCAAYSWVAATSECSLKWSAGSATAKDGVVSAELKDVAANDKCPTQQKNMVFSGADIRKVTGVSNWQCCDECGKTAGCAAYSWVAATSECSLKWSAGSATAKDGVVSAELKDVAANDKCPTQQKNMVFSGADIRKVTGVSNWQCCDECGKTAGCAAYSWVAATSECSLKWSAGSATAKDGVVSAELKDVAANDKCPTQQKNMVFSGADIRKVTGVSNWQCCDECGKTAGCAAYSWVAATSECSLKWSAGSATAKDGVVSAELKDVAANDKCPTQQKNMVFSGADIRKVTGVSNWQCCDECGKTAGCAAYSWVAATSECSLKWSAGSATAKDGVVSAELKDVAANDKCPTQQKNMVFSGADIRKVTGVSNWQCCDECGKTAGCAAYSWVAATSECSLKWSAGSATAKDGVVSAELKDVAANDKCPTQQKNMVFSGADIRKVTGVSNWQCCDECGKTAGCAAYSWVAATSECSLKWSAGSATAKDGVVSGTVKDVLKPETCAKQEGDVDYWGNDIRAVFGGTVSECCDECFRTDGCVGYSFVKPSWLGKWQLPSACYLKWSTAGAQPKRGIVSAKLNPRLPPKQCSLQEQDIDYYGNDIKCLHAVTNAQCCEACAKTKGCRAYTYVKGYDVFGLWWSPSACYLKSSAAGRCTKKGLISGKVTGA